MDHAAILALYDAETRADPPAMPGYEHVWAEGVLRTLGAHNFIGWWTLDAPETVAAVAREAAFFRDKGVQWKVFDHDGPPNLSAALAAAGFQEEDVETFLVLDMQAISAAAEPPLGFTVREVKDSAGIADLMAVSAAAFGREGHWSEAQVDALIGRLGHPSLAAFVAYDGGVPVSSGRLELAPGKAFASLYGGGTRPDYQGRGVYRALVAARAAEARRRGHRFLTVDARETSRPILERIGFQPLTKIRDWTLPAG